MLQVQLVRHRKMTAAISHEIRTPLNTAFLGLDLLIAQQHQHKLQRSQQCITNTRSTGSLSEEEMLNSVKEGCSVALNILNQLLTFEKLSAGMMMLESSLVSLSSLLAPHISLFTLQASSKQIRFALDTSAGGKDKADILLSDTYVFVDPVKIGQVLRNLLSNAMKFTKDHGEVVLFVDYSHSIMVADDARSSKGSKVRYPPSSYHFQHVDSLKEGKMQGGDNLVHVDIADYRACGYVRIAVVDSGPGISKEDQALIFHDYVQIAAGSLQDGQGTGLGLSISKSIMDLHGGRIGLYSEGKGAGACFYLDLPLYRSNAIDARTSSTITSSSDSTITDESGEEIEIDVFNLETTPTVDLYHSTINAEECNKPTLSVNAVEKGIVPNLPATPTAKNLNESPIIGHKICGLIGVMGGRKLRILLVDDSVMTRKLLRHSLELDGHIILEAGDGMTAVNMLASQSAQDGANIDVILLDYHMPGITGVEVCEKMRSKPIQYKGIIIGLTGLTMDEDSESFLLHGANAVLSKPVQLQTIYKSILPHLSPSPISS